MSLIKKKKDILKAKSIHDQVWEYKANISKRKLTVNCLII